MKNLKKIFSFVILISIFLSIGISTNAQFIKYEEGVKEQADAFRQTAGYEGTEGSQGITQIISTVIQVILGLLATIFLVLIIYSGYNWMTAGGNEEKITKAKGILKNAIIGLIITLGAYSITWFVFNYLPFAGGGGGTTSFSDDS